MKCKDELIVVPFSPDTPYFLSDEFWQILDRLLHIDVRGVIFPFYVAGYVRHYGAMFINDGKICCMFGEDFGSNVLKIDGEMSICAYLFPYIYANKICRGDINIVIDDECVLEEEKYLRDKFGENLLIVSPPPCAKRDTIDKKLLKRQKIIIQSLEKLLK